MSEDSQAEKPSTTLTGTVQKIIPPFIPSEAEKAQIGVEGADHLYRELRIKNELIDDEGERVKLKPGAEIELTIEASPDQTTKKDS